MKLFSFVYFLPILIIFSFIWLIFENINWNHRLKMWLAFEWLLAACSVVVVNLVLFSKNWFIFSKWFISFSFSSFQGKKMKVQFRVKQEWLFSLQFQLINHMFPLTFVSKLIIIWEAKKIWQFHTQLSVTVNFKETTTWRSTLSSKRKNNIKKETRDIDRCCCKPLRSIETCSFNLENKSCVIFHEAEQERE